MPNFASAIAANPPPSAIAARHVVPAACAANATVTIATAEIAMAAAAKVDVGGTLPTWSWILSTTAIATRHQSGSGNDPRERREAG